VVDLDCLAAEEEEEVEEGSTMSILRLRVVMVEGFVWFGGREVGRGFGREEVNGGELSVLKI
jgi:hypothetical protein